MKLSTRIKLSYILVFVIPILMIVGVAAGSTPLRLRALQQRYDLDVTNYEMLLNPTSMLSHMNTSIMRELDEVIGQEPDKLKDRGYLEEVNVRLSSRSTYIMVTRDGEVIYSGLPEKQLDGQETVRTPKEPMGQGGLIYNDLPYHIQTREIAFTDGKSGELFILTDINQLIPGMQNYVSRILLLAVLILSAMSGLTMFWLYRSIIRPINKLKVAAENITAGNLNVSVTAETEDEIGELCTAFEAMRIKLKSQIEQNMQTEKDSKELISNISHDLKTPMTSIKGYVEGLMDGVADTPEKQERYVRTIYNKVNDMNSLVDELFLFAKLDSNAVTYSFVKLNVCDYFEDCAEELSLDLEAQGVDFGFFNYVDPDVVVIADPEQLKRVVSNIVGNSVKYASPDRPLMISLRITEEEEFIRVEIEDNGKGIAKNEIPLIFERLYRTDASRNSSRGGSGLGLSIAKKIIEEHGGKIWAQSTEGVGTTMVFVLRKVL